MQARVPSPGNTIGWSASLLSSARNRANVASGRSFVHETTAPTRYPCRFAIAFATSFPAGSTSPQAGHMSARRPE